VKRPKEQQLRKQQSSYKFNLMMRRGVDKGGQGVRVQCRGVGTSMWASLLGFCPWQHATTSATAAAATTDRRTAVRHVV